jgi:virginiamycin B lyase
VAGSSPGKIVSGPDGALWFTDSRGDRIVRFSPGGEVTSFPTPRADSNPSDIALGPDGNLWFTERNGGKIGRITTSGVFTEFVLPAGGSEPLGITSGPDGEIWFTELSGNKIGRITGSGEIAEFPIPSSDSSPLDITLGPDGHLWFTESTAGRIATIREGTCAPDATALCLNSARFKVEVSWSAPSQGTSGVGRALSLTGVSGAFWFFDSSNLELLVKVVDGRAFNGHFWVFVGALTDVEYRLTVTDTQELRTSRTYFNPPGRVSSVADTAAFPN